MADGRGDSLRAAIDARVADSLRSGKFAEDLGPARASANAQSAGGGLGIENIRRGVGRAVLTDTGGTIMVPVGGFAALSTPLRLEMVLSGRPLRVEVSGLFTAVSGGTIILDILLRGVSMSGVANGVAYTNINAVVPFHGFELAMAPAPGRATIEVVASAATGAGSLYADGNNRVILAATEE